VVVLSEKVPIQISSEIYEKLNNLSKSLNVDINKLIDLAFYELFDLVLSDSSIFLEKIGTIDNLKKIISEK